MSIKVSAQSTASQQVAIFDMEAPQLETSKTIWIYLPKSYQNSTKAYSVVYMQDAQNLFDDKTSYVGEWKIDEYLDSIVNDETIIVGIEHGNEKRMDELTPYAHPTHGGGKADRYLEFMRDALKPKIDSMFRTKPDAKHTSIIGSSLGGLLSFYAIIKFPDTFGSAGVFSPSFWFSERIYALVDGSEIPASSRFYFLAGSEESGEMVPDLHKMTALLKKKGVKSDHITSKIIEGGKHNEALWRDNFPEAYHWLIKN